MANRFGICLWCCSLFWIALILTGQELEPCEYDHISRLNKIVSIEVGFNESELNCSTTMGRPQAGRQAPISTCDRVVLKDYLKSFEFTCATAKYFMTMAPTNLNRYRFWPSAYSSMDCSILETNQMYQELCDVDPPLLKPGTKGCTDNLVLMYVTMYSSNVRDCQTFQRASKALPSDFPCSRGEFARRSFFGQKCYNDSELFPTEPPKKCDTDFLKRYAQVSGFTCATAEYFMTLSDSNLERYKFWPASYQGPDCTKFEIDQLYRQLCDHSPPFLPPGTKGCTDNLVLVYVTVFSFNVRDCETFRLAYQALPRDFPCSIQEFAERSYFDQMCNSQSALTTTNNPLSQNVAHDGIPCTNCDTASLDSYLKTSGHTCETDRDGLQVQLKKFLKSCNCTPDDTQQMIQTVCGGTSAAYNIAALTFNVSNVILSWMLAQQ